MNARPLFGALLITLLSISEPILAATTVPSLIEGDTTWTAAESPYQFNGPTNFSPNTPGATLTMEPGTSLEFDPGASLTIFGNLSAEGTSELPISVSGVGWQIVIFDSPESRVSYWNTVGAGNGLLVFNSNLTASNFSANDSNYGLMGFDSQLNLSNFDFSDAEILFDNVTGSLLDLSLLNGSLLVFNSALTLATINIFNAPRFRLYW